MEATPRIKLFPETAEVNEEGHLTIGGCNTMQLASEFGTPLYIIDEMQIRRKCAEFRDFRKYYTDTAVLYAAKALLNRTVLAILKEEGLGLDVVSGGELQIAVATDFPMNKVYFHGNNKSTEELRLAIENRIGRIVVDNFHELKILNDIAGEMNTVQDILLRISPGIDPHTHKYIATGIVDSKFGFLLTSADQAVAQAQSASNLNLIGLHCHLGSLLFESEPYREAIRVMMNLAASLKQKYAFELKEFNIGGGFAVQYTLDSPAPDISYYAGIIASELVKHCNKLNLAQPRLIIEPGRAIIGQAGVALYKVGAIKDIPGIRRYVSVDGGMADNIRPALYESRYEALIANKASEAAKEKVTISGKFCESGDILINDISLPPVSSGDIIAIPDSGAYCLSMASNYNCAFKPAVVMVRKGKAQLIRRRETIDDLLSCDLG